MSAVAVHCYAVPHLEKVLWLVSVQKCYDLYFQCLHRRNCDGPTVPHSWQLTQSTLAQLC